MENTCVICFEKVFTTVTLFPCKHEHFCSNCIFGLVKHCHRKSPLCRCDIKEYKFVSDRVSSADEIIMKVLFYLIVVSDDSSMKSLIESKSVVINLLIDTMGDDEVQKF